MRSHFPKMIHSSLLANLFTGIVPRKRWQRRISHRSLFLAERCEERLLLTTTPIFINEFHYDDVGVDSNEGFEVAGPAGTNLSGFQIVLYDGEKGLIYDTISLSGIIGDKKDGIGTLSFSAPSNVEEGAPDGFALIDNNSNVLQFLSYEGTFTALEGPANNMISVDVGVMESDSTPENSSLQLQGTGTCYEDFTWNVIQGSNTFGDFNVNQNIYVIPQTIYVTTEVDERDGTSDPSFGNGTSLREAVIDANKNPDVTTIRFHSSLNGTPIVLVITGSSENSSAIGDLDINTQINIIGNGIANTILDGGSDVDNFLMQPGLAEGIIHVTNTGELDISGVKMTGGYRPLGGGGGAIYNENILTVSDSLIERNLYTGIYSDFGTTTIINTRFTGNRGNFGGGLKAEGGSLVVRNSLFDDNFINGWGGGVFLDGVNSAFIINSTISGNRSENDGGGIHSRQGLLKIVNSTITGNRSGINDTANLYVGGGIYSAGFVELKNTIVAGNYHGNPLHLDPDEVAGSQQLAATSANNLIGDATFSGGLVDGVNVNIVGALTHDVLDPVLRDNGGPTLTHALVPNSPAWNRGRDLFALDENSNPLTTDQRGTGFARIQDGRVDIGAYEGFRTPHSSIVGFVNGNWWLTRSEGFDDVYDTAIAANGPASTFQQVLTGDFNGDGIDDLAVWLFNGEWRVGVGDANGNFTFSTWTTWTHPEIKEVHVGDFNDDGLDDIIGLFRNGNRGRWWVGQSDGTQFLNRHWGDYGNYNGINDVVVGNFDGVKGDDLAIIANSGVVWMYKTSNSSFQFLNSHTWNISNGFDFAQAGDFNGDGRDDLVASFGNTSARSIFVAKSQGPSTGFASLKFADLTATQSFDNLVVGDFNGDGKDDVAARLNTTRWWVGLAGVNVFNFSLWTTWSFATNGVSDIHVGSTNRDAFSEILGRASTGDWYSAESNGTAFTNRVIDAWSASASWQYVQSRSDLGLGPVLSEDAESFEPIIKQINPNLAGRWSAPAEEQETAIFPEPAPLPALSTITQNETDDEAYDSFGESELFKLLYAV
ncbi:MAG: VCBS repeat-containing protein [Planctomycetaceae bacterium]|nr:VCBS repeat-containing protein [Planctomycetaceae bacterium]